MKFSERGFTLAESLLVLSVFMIVSSITAFSLKPQYEKAEMESFLTQFQADLFYAQQYAMVHQSETTINIQADQHYYYIRARYDQPLLVRREYSKNINVRQLSQPLFFKFTPDGNISKFGSLSIKLGTKSYQLTFLIGKGRFYVTEK
ncbi:competence type IV pilus minor pilin ComGD [Bacillota bacterium Lsc_1132]